MTASELGGPMRDVVYIFERAGSRGGSFWWLVLDCGHAVARKRTPLKSDTVLIHLLLKPVEEKLAPKRAQCHYCGSGSAPRDPWALVKALGGDVP